MAAEEHMDARRIPIANLYHLLCYAWDQLEMDALIGVDADDHPGFVELLTHVLTRGCVHLAKQGLHHDYVAQTAALRTLRGKLELGPSLATASLPRGIAVCTHDEFTADILANQLLKATLLRSARLPGLPADLALAARQVAQRMPGVSLIEPRLADLSRVTIHRNNRFYGFLLSICRLLLESTSVRESDRTLESAQLRCYGLIEARLPTLFEAFVSNFYKRHLPAPWRHRGRQDIQWALLTDDPSASAFLPKMQTDITLEHPDRKLIIDTKFYGSGGLTSNAKFESANLYQLNAYLTQLARQAALGGNSRPHPCDDRADGMLLYAAVGDVAPFASFAMPPHRITVASVDLRGDWRAIESHLLALI
jgi:5-methylcytosine-specific restriction enzyme subunit McrC